MGTYAYVLKCVLLSTHLRVLVFYLSTFKYTWPHACYVYTMVNNLMHAIILLSCAGASDSSSEDEMGFDLFGGGGDEESVVKCVLFYLHV